MKVLYISIANLGKAALFISLYPHGENLMSVNNTTSLVYVVDDEFAIRDSLTLLIESTGQKVKSFESAEAFLNSYDPDQSGCLLLDVRMPLMSGHDLQNELLIRGIRIPIIFISGHADIPDSAKAFRAGAVDFLEKPFDNDMLLERINEAIKKDIAFREEYAKKSRIQDRINHLTTREKEVLSLIVKSHSNKESAKILNISNRTVDVHRASIMEKMQAENVAELITMVMYCEEPIVGLQEERFH
jgi:FixJ family two-component response regulator